MAKSATNGKKNGESKEAPKSTEQLLKEEKSAREEWYGHFNGGAPRKPYTKEASAALRTLEKAKSALVNAVGAENFKEAAKKLNYSPQYAPRTRTPAETPAAKK